MRSLAKAAGSMLSEAFCHFDSLSCTTHFHVRVHSMYQQAIQYTLYHSVSYLHHSKEKKTSWMYANLRKTATLHKRVLTHFVESIGGVFLLAVLGDD